MVITVIGCAGRQNCSKKQVLGRRKTETQYTTKYRGDDTRPSWTFRVQEIVAMPVFFRSLWSLASMVSTERLQQHVGLQFHQQLLVARGTTIKHTLDIFALLAQEYSLGTTVHAISCPDASSIHTTNLFFPFPLSSCWSGPFHEPYHKLTVRPLKMIK